MLMFNEERKQHKIYFYGFDRLHQLQGKPWYIRDEWISIENIHETAQRMLRQLNTTEVLVIDASYETGREYKDLTKLEHWKSSSEHILFYDFLKSKPHFRFGLG